MMTYYAVTNIYAIDNLNYQYYDKTHRKEYTFIHGVFRILSFTGYTENTQFDGGLSIPLKTLCIISTL
jgi:hypothetical protein